MLTRSHILHNRRRKVSKWCCQPSLSHAFYVDFCCVAQNFNINIMFTHPLDEWHRLYTNCKRADNANANKGRDTETTKCSKKIKQLPIDAACQTILNMKLNWNELDFFFSGCRRCVCEWAFARQNELLYLVLENWINRINGRMGARTHTHTRGQQQLKYDSLCSAYPKVMCENACMRSEDNMCRRKKQIHFEWSGFEVKICIELYSTSLAQRTKKWDVEAILTFEKSEELLKTHKHELEHSSSTRMVEAVFCWVIMCEKDLSNHVQYIYSCFVFYPHVSRLLLLSMA